MKNKVYKGFLILTTVLLSVIYLFPNEPGAVTRTNQTSTCYLANPLTEKPSRQGYNYVAGVTAASQVNVKYDKSAPPKIPWGTWVTISKPAPIPGVGNTSRFRIDDTGDIEWKQTPYFVDVYWGGRTTANGTSCVNNWGIKTVNVTY
ncbi:hypothetical protein KGR20_23820 [Cytobacillus oceanisediminis]|uniref:Uncharacterized protein n=1 Tax=Niallia alba TaxID=2729105 RepID=A0A7Y0PLT7_9BACI|nr:MULTISPECIES: hypothetical protein [Bacillaceae]MBQ6448481.1 hypothetical protein [Bacillus sp. (in: firmicutes)]MBZ9537179.1 hypothetical protein [Cytobacillus oceanisediminis]NMO77060.1 hypothetical protein [Niallia alba]